MGLYVPPGLTSSCAYRVAFLTYFYWIFSTAFLHFEVFLFLKASRPAVGLFSHLFDEYRDYFAGGKLAGA
jgi:hypothetical protein